MDEVTPQQCLVQGAFGLGMWEMNSFWLLNTNSFDYILFELHVLKSGMCVILSAVLPTQSCETEAQHSLVIASQTDSYR